jgi:aspartyl-tRNA(Asn)/glutamyl-tRNA(Gln) amidotransferase subunit C
MVDQLSPPPESAGVISTDQVRHLAVLSRIALTDDEIEHLAGELTQIVESVATVQRVATADVPATSHPVPLVNVFRDDVVGDVLTRDQVLSGAPDEADGRFRVSAILGEEQ